MNRSEFPPAEETFDCRNADDAAHALTQIIGQSVFTHQAVLDKAGMLWATSDKGLRGMYVRLSTQKGARNVAQYLFSEVLLKGLNYPNPPKTTPNPTKGWRIESLLIEGHPAAAMIQTWY